MKSIVNKLTAIAILFIIAGCSNDFLNENLDLPSVPGGDSSIYLSPEWEADDYQMLLPNIGSAAYKIEKLPAWMHVDSHTGTLVNSMAMIHCSATKYGDFEKTGIYIDKMQVSAGGQTFHVPVAYISEGTPKIQVEKTLALNFAYDSPFLEIRNTDAGILIWDIVSLPDWLMVDADRFYNLNRSGTIIPQNSSTQVPFMLNPDADYENGSTGTIVLKTNDKSNPTVEVKVTVDLGNLEISVWLSEGKIDFGATATTYSLDIDAWGSGLLVWHFEGLPNWLTATPAKGKYQTHTYYEDVILTCDRSKLQPGLNSAVIYLKSNAYNKPSIEITVMARAPGDNTHIRQLEGDIVDATFDKNTNTLYYTCSQPDKFVAYDIVNRRILHELQLSKAPTCFAISEDFTHAAIGHDGIISAVNLGNWSATQSDITSAVYDMAWSEGDWYCYTTGYGDGLRWLNTANQATHKSTDMRLHGHAIIKKVPTQPYIVATNQYVYPSGFLVYSNSTKELKSYAHMRLSRFWFTQDGQHTFGLIGDVYRTSSATSSDDQFNTEFGSIGQLKASDDYVYNWIDHSAATHRIWGIHQSHDSNIYLFDDTNFTFKKSYPYFDVYQPNAQTTAYEVEAHYVFANKEGTELTVLRKGKNNNQWSVEFIQVTQ